MPRPVDKGTTYVPGLDGLRTLAVAAVILYHLNVSGVPGGLLGVGVFFTLSGYLITANLMRSRDRRGNFGLKTFWLRRFRRLAPAMIVTVIAVLILTTTLDRGAFTDRAGEALSTLFYVNNWHAVLSETSYFDNFAGPGPLDHMWSLSVEEQFYLVWPLVLLALMFLLRNRRGLVAVATVALAVASFALMWVLADPASDTTRVYEGTDTRAGGLLLGAALAVWLSARRSAGRSTEVSRPAAAVLGLVGVAEILALVILVDRDSMFLYHGGIALLTVAAGCAILAVLRIDGLWSRIFGCLPMRWLGERSYGIYLWHMPVIAFLPAGWLTDHLIASAVITVGISVILAALSWTLFEDPIRRHGVVTPVKNWLAQWRHDRAVPVAAQGRLRRYAGAGAGVVMTAVLAIGAPAVLADPDGATATASGKGGGAAGQGMELEDRGPAVADPAATPADGTALMSCTRVIHVGDSTSLGIFNPDMLPDPADVGENRYLEHGAGEVVTSVFGGRNTTEGFEDYPSAVDSVAELLGQGQPDGTCWVIATGVNDAANISAGATYDEEQRIRMMLDQLTGQRVMWSNTKTRLDTGHWDNANMVTFNEVLARVTKDYPDVVVWDWASEVSDHMDWFLDGDDVHYNAEGNAARGRLFAAALANAFPADGDTGQPGGRIVHSGL
ncbi:acyltransferase family protein [Corynebacterium nuruki]|uniref:acyltransferase family protein n=1 Tax=Corynebacterium nuruki TaxID=1032851 RepID=UPI0039BF91EB